MFTSIHSTAGLLHALQGGTEDIVSSLDPQSNAQQPIAQPPGVTLTITCTLVTMTSHLHAYVQCGPCAGSGQAVVSVP